VTNAHDCSYKQGRVTCEIKMLQNISANIAKYFQHPEHMLKTGPCWLCVK